MMVVGFGNEDQINFFNFFVWEGFLDGDEEGVRGVFWEGVSKRWFTLFIYFILVAYCCVLLVACLWLARKFESLDKL